MRTDHELSTATPETIRQQLQKTVEVLISKVLRKQDVSDDMQQVSDFLQSLPLATGEFALVCNRLENARRYLSSHEHGAAHYELQLIAGSFRNGQKPIPDTTLRKQSR